MHDSDKLTEQALRQAETARGKLMGGDRAGAAEALREAIESNAAALRLLGYSVAVQVEGPER